MKIAVPTPSHCRDHTAFLFEKYAIFGKDFTLNKQGYGKAKLQNRY